MTNGQRCLLDTSETTDSKLVPVTTDRSIVVRALFVFRVRFWFLWLFEFCKPLPPQKLAIHLNCRRGSVRGRSPRCPGPRHLIPTSRESFEIVRSCDCDFAYGRVLQGLGPQRRKHGAYVGHTVDVTWYGVSCQRQAQSIGERVAVPLENMVAPRAKVLGQVTYRSADRTLVPVKASDFYRPPKANFWRYRLGRRVEDAVLTKGEFLISYLDPGVIQSKTEVVQAAPIVCGV
mmetsp:Transcript_8811/g.18282  ORF Transcript_8811/g.18282 Transcript_8811/m.18282 type:complete len:232 (-) Transcript_8811:399-1094(-)